MNCLLNEGLNSCHNAVFVSQGEVLCHCEGSLWQQLQDEHRQSPRAALALRLRGGRRHPQPLLWRLHQPLGGQELRRNHQSEGTHECHGTVGSHGLLDDMEQWVVTGC